MICKSSAFFFLAKFICLKRQMIQIYYVNNPGIKEKFCGYLKITIHFIFRGGDFYFAEG